MRGYNKNNTMMGSRGSRITKLWPPIKVGSLNLKHSNQIKNHSQLLIFYRKPPKDPIDLSKSQDKVWKQKEMKCCRQKYIESNNSAKLFSLNLKTPLTLIHIPRLDHLACPQLTSKCQ